MTQKLKRAHEDLLIFNPTKIQPIYLKSRDSRAMLEEKAQYASQLDEERKSARGCQRKELSKSIFGQNKRGMNVPHRGSNLNTNARLENLAALLGDSELMNYEAPCPELPNNSTNRSLPTKPRDREATKNKM